MDEFPAGDPSLSGVGESARLADMALRAFSSMWAVADAWSREKVGKQNRAVGWGGSGEEEQWQKDWWQTGGGDVGLQKGKFGQSGGGGSGEGSKNGEGKRTDVYIASQEKCAHEAVQRAQSDGVTVMIGPPGCGKTQVLGLVSDVLCSEYAGGVGKVVCFREMPWHKEGAVLQFVAKELVEGTDEGKSWEEELWKHGIKGNKVWSSSIEFKHPRFCLPVS